MPSCSVNIIMTLTMMMVLWYFSWPSIGQEHVGWKGLVEISEVASGQEDEKSNRANAES